MYFNKLLLVLFFLFYGLMFTSCVNQDLRNELITATIIVPFKKPISINYEQPIRISEFTDHYADSKKYEMIANQLDGLSNSNILRSANQFSIYVTANRQDIEQICKENKLNYLVDNTFFTWDGNSYSPQHSFSSSISKELVENNSHGGYPLSEVRAIYNIPEQLKGTNQTVALITVGKPSINDVNFFAKRNKIGYTPLSSLNSQQNKIDNFIKEEATLAYESVRATAPNAKLEVFSTQSSSLSDMTELLSRGISSTTSRILVICWSIPEEEIPVPIREIWHTLLQEATIQGITIIANTGIKRNDQLKEYIGYPASDPLVIAVSGATKGPNEFFEEWDKSAITVGEKWKKDKNYSLEESLNKERNVPDVFMIADPNWGFKGFLSGKEVKVGGTSIIAPMFAGILANIFEANNGAVLHVRNKLLQLNRDAFFEVKPSGQNRATNQLSADSPNRAGVPNTEKMIEYFLKK
ncbi:S8 family serine peptidase [Brevibacillus laterosporus]|uniref:S8 family serine peptidase n=1 Tax=Brevibacillus laterosporus TaxID=1465 RepID=UPI003D195A36